MYIFVEPLIIKENNISINTVYWAKYVFGKFIIVWTLNSENNFFINILFVHNVQTNKIG